MKRFTAEDAERAEGFEVRVGGKPRLAAFAGRHPLPAGAGRGYNEARQGTS